MGIDFKFNEDKVLKEIEEYISATYDQHYTTGSGTQLMDLIRDSGEDIIFNRWNVIKYVQRFGHKDGYNRKDLLKAAHYIILMLGSETPNNSSGKGS